MICRGDIRTTRSSPMPLHRFRPAAKLARLTLPHQPDTAAGRDFEAQIDSLKTHLRKYPPLRIMFRLSRDDPWISSSSLILLVVGFSHAGNLCRLNPCPVFEPISAPDHPALVPRIAPLLPRRQLPLAGSHAARNYPHVQSPTPVWHR